MVPHLLPQPGGFEVFTPTAVEADTHDASFAYREQLAYFSLDGSSAGAAPAALSYQCDHPVASVVRLRSPVPFAPPNQSHENSKCDALKLEYEYLRDENRRLRDSRASITRQLGPLPIGAAVVAGLVTGFTANLHNRLLLGIALGLFVLLVAVSVRYSSMKPYRVLRQEAEEERPTPPRPRSSPEAWYDTAISLEEAIYGKPTEDTGLRRHLPKSNISGLQEGFDRERTGLFIVQGLFALVIVLLILSRIV